MQKKSASDASSASLISPPINIENHSNLPIANWHLGNTDLEAKLSEFEFLLWRLFYSFIKWHEDCQRCVTNEDGVSADEIALMHLIRMRDRPKTISEIARLMNRDDTSNLHYSLKKLLKLNIIRKSKKSSKKSVFFEITGKGVSITEKYGDIRRNILIKLLKNTEKLEWNILYDFAKEFKNIYDEASRTASLSPINSNYA